VSAGGNSISHLSPAAGRIARFQFSSDRRPLLCGAKVGRLRRT